MAYKPPSISNASVSGMARVLINKKDPTKVNKVKVELTRKVDGADKTETYILDKADCPKWIKSGLWRVRMNATGDKMWNATPSDANVMCVFAGISHKENELPAPKLVTGGSWKGKKLEDYWQFILNVKVVEGEYEGMEIPIFLRYNFGPIMDGGKEVVAYTHDGPQSKHTPFLKKVLEALGVWEKGPMKWDDNILPMIQKRAMKQAEEGRKLMVSLTDGSVANVKQLVEDAWDDEDEEGSEEAVTASEPSNTPHVEPDPDEDEEETVAQPVMEEAASDDIPWEDDDTEG